MALINFFVTRIYISNLSLLLDPPPPNNTIVGVDHIKGPFRGPLEQQRRRRRRRPQRMKETEHHYFTPLGQCQRAPAGK